MTREEAIHILGNLKPTNTKSSFDAYVVGKAITIAIKALEQEPCEDAISRKDVYELIEDINDTVFGQQVSKGVANLPSVQPQPKSDVLDEIRDEIKLEKHGYPPSAGYYKAIMKCLQIIDKYKAEVEPHESEDAE